MKHVITYVKSKVHQHSLRNALSLNENINHIEMKDLEQLQQMLQFGTKFDLIVSDLILEDFKPIGDKLIVWDIESQEVAELHNAIKEKIVLELYENHTSMPLHLFNHFSRLPVDVFIKMQKNGKSHFVQRFLANDEITQEDLDAFKARGISELWIEKDSLKSFSKEVIALIKEEIQHKTILIDDVQVSENIFKSLGDMIQKVGVKSAVVDLCDTWMTNLAKSSLTCMHSPVKDWYLRLSQDSSLDFHFKLVRLTTLLCGQYVLSTDWVSKDEQAARLAGVALFADMSLNNPNYIHYRSYEMIQDLKGEEKLLVSSHAQRSSQMISQVNFIAKDISLLVAQHHGCPDGEKIPQRISANVSALAYIYMLSEEMAYSLLKDSNLSMEVVFEGLKKKFSGTPVLNYLSALPRILDIY